MFIAIIVPNFSRPHVSPPKIIRLSHRWHFQNAKLTFILLLSRKSTCQNYNFVAKNHYLCMIFYVLLRIVNNMMISLL